MNDFETLEKLERWLESDESEDMRDLMFSELFEIDLDSVCECPYWVEQYCRDERIFVEYIPGYYEPKHYGDLIEIDGDKYIYVDSIKLDEEVEHQADDGGLAYEYRGSSFLRVLMLVEGNVEKLLEEIPNYKEIERNVWRFDRLSMVDWVAKIVKEVA